MKKSNFYQMLVFSSLYVGYAINVYIRRSFTFALPAVINSEGLKESHLGLVTSSQTIAYSISKFLGGFLADRYNAKFLFQASLFLTGVSAVLFTGFSSIWMFTFWWFLNGLCQGPSWPACAKMLMAWFPPKHFGTWWSILSTSMNVAGTIGPLITTFLTIHYGWRISMLLPGFSCILLVCVFGVSIYERPSDLGLPDYLDDHSDNKSVPSDNRSLHSDNRSLPSDNRSLHSNNKSVPSDNRSVPSNNRSVPSDNRSVPSDNRSLPSDNRSLPSDNRSLPSDNRSLPSDNRSEQDVDKGVTEFTKIYCILLDPFLLLLGVNNMVLFVIRTCVMDWGQLYLIHEKQLSTIKSSMLTGSMEVGGILGSLAAGYLSDKAQAMQEQQQQLNGTLRLNVARDFCFGVFVFLFSLIFYINKDSYQIWIIFVGCGLGFCLYGPLAVFGVVAMKSVPPYLCGTAHSVVSIFANMGAVLSGYPATFMASYIGWHSMFVLLNFLSIGTMVSLWHSARMNCLISSKHKKQRTL